MLAPDKTLAPQDNVLRYLSHWAGVFPDKPAIVFPREVRDDGTLNYAIVSFGELDSQVNRLAAVLRSRGLVRGDRVVVMIPMSLELYTLILALLKLAVVIVFIDPWVGLAQIKRCVALTEPKAFAGVPAIQLIGRLSGALKTIPIRITARGKARGSEWQLEKLWNETAPAVETEVVDPDTTALITFTTGSTGIPKGANRTHGFLVAQHLALSRELGLTPADVDLPALPIFVLNNLACGVTSVIPKMNPSRPADIEPAIILKQIEDHGVTTGVGSPTYFAPLADYCLAHGFSMPNVRAIFTGGAPVPPGLLGKLRRVLPSGTAYVGYGSTEAEPIAVISGEEVIAETGERTAAGEGNCVGRLAEGIHARLVPVQAGPITLGPSGWAGFQLASDEIGEVVVAGDHVGKDYFRNPEAVKEAKIRDADGTMWHRTGDVGRFDVQGRLWLVGRVNNLVDRAGVRYYPIQVEAIAHQLPFIKDVAMVGVPNAVIGMSLAIAVVPFETNPFQWWRKRAEWELRLRDLLERHQVPVDAIRFIRRMPVDPRHNAKIDYGKLRKLFRSIAT